MWFDYGKMELRKAFYTYSNWALISATNNPRSYSFNFFSHVRPKVSPEIFVKIKILLKFDFHTIDYIAIDKQASINRQTHDQTKRALIVVQIHGHITWQVLPVGPIAAKINWSLCLINLILYSIPSIIPLILSFCYIDS